MLEKYWDDWCHYKLTGIPRETVKINFGKRRLSKDTDNIIVKLGNLYYSRPTYGTCQVRMTTKHAADSHGYQEEMPGSLSRYIIEYIDREAYVAYLEKALKAKKHEKGPSQSKEERQAAIKEIELDIEKAKIIAKKIKDNLYKIYNIFIRLI